MRLFPAGLAQLPTEVLHHLMSPGPVRAQGRAPRRVVEGRSGRAYVPVRAVHRPAGEVVARAVEGALRSLDGVQWAEVNPLLGEVAVAFDRERVGAADLVAVVDQVEATHGLEGRDFAPDAPEHPADPAPIERKVAALLADAAGLSLGAVAGVVRAPRLPVELTSVIPAMDSLPVVRRFLEHRPLVETATVVLNAAVQGLGQGPMGLVVDAAHHVTTLTELQARRRAWQEAEPHLYRPRGAEPLPADPAGERPVPLPKGTLETYGQVSMVSSLAGGAAALALTRDVRRGADMLLVGAPRAIRVGREGFAAQIGRDLAGRKVVTMDPRALRRLDRVDCLVVAATAVVTDRWVIGEVLPLDPDPGAPVEETARELFDPEKPAAVVERGEWQLAPAKVVAAGWPRGARARARERAGAGRRVLALARDDLVVALLTVQRELRPGAEDLIEAATRAGHHLAVAGDRTEVSGLLGIGRVVAGGDFLIHSVRALQGEGRVVALVTERPGAALRASDCGIGVARSETDHPPWGAHLMCGDLGQAAAIVDASRLARVAAGQIAALAGVGSIVGGLFALGPRAGANRRAITAVQCASLGALGLGTWTAAQLPKRRPIRRVQRTSWHSASVSEVLEHLGTSSEGLSASEAARRLRPMHEDDPPGFVSLLAGQLTNPVSVLLSAGAALSAAVGSLGDAAMIAGVIGVDAAVDIVQRLRTEAAIERLQSSVSQANVRVRRDGAEMVTGARQLVPGDVVRLVPGDAVPADCRILDASSLEVDESSLTGESLPVQKDAGPLPVSTAVADRRSMVYSGTAVAAGRGSAVVVATGPDTEAGRSADAAPSPPTGVETRLRKLTTATVPVVIGAGAGLALNSLLRGRQPREAVASGVSLAAAAVPEGLPFVATAAQTSAARRLASRGVLVRNPRVLEALGRVDVLCFDKTGTLTEGHLRLQRVSDGVSDEPVGELGHRSRLVLAAALRATPRRRAEKLPHPTDQAIVDGATAARVRTSTGAPTWHKVASIPFESGRGYHAVLGRANGQQLLSVKGAPEVVLERCTALRHNGGEVVELDQAGRAAAEEEVERLARRGLRVLAVAEREASDRGDLEDERVDRLELCGFVGVADSTRPTAASPLEKLRQAGINVVMVTGDHPSTAEAIASELGLLNGRLVLSGAQLDDLSDDQLDAVVGDVGVFARVTPADKVRIVAAFQRTGRVVAMTGDGANDAQAIRLAEVGVAFGQRATSAARDAADLVVIGDEVEALIEAVSEGRSMWASVRDALALLLGGNLGEIVFTTGAALLIGRSPLNPRQLLTVNLFTDLAPAMVIAMQPTRPDRADLAREGPETSLAGQLGRDVVIRAAATAGGAYAAWLLARPTGTSTRASTVALVSLVGAQLGQTLVVGRRSPMVVGTALISTGALMALVQTPGVSQFLGCRPLGPVAWTISIGSAAAATGAAVVAGALVR